MIKKSSVFIRAKKKFKLVMNFCWLWITRTNLKLNDVYIDQELLFEGAICHLYWKTQGAYKITLYINNKFEGSFTPQDIPVIPINNNLTIKCVAYGAFEKVSRTLLKHVIPTTFKEIGQLELLKFADTMPRIVVDMELELLSFEPKNLNPIFSCSDIMLESSQMKTEENELNLQMETAQKNFSTKPYHNGN